MPRPGFPTRLLAWALTYLCLRVSAEVDPIITKGSHFFYKTNGTAFFIRGVAYFPYTQGGGGQSIDPLADPDMCARDIPYISALGMNVVHIPYIDPGRDHSACMNAFADAGIYVLAQLAFSVDSPRESNGYTERTLAQSIGILDSLAPFPNTLGFLIGYAVTSRDIPFLDANLRDVKAHLEDKKYRDVPIGWTAAYNATTPERDTLDAMMCNKPRMDFLGLVDQVIDGRVANCTPTEEIVRAAESFVNATVPVFFVYSGCKTDGSGDWDYVSKAYSENITTSLSGVVVDEYFNTVYGSSVPYGLISFNVTVEGKIQRMPGYSALSSVLATAKPSFTDAAKYTPTATLPVCPTGTTYNVSSILPPRPYAELCACLSNTLRCIVKKGSIDKLDPNGGLNTALQTLCENNEPANCPGIVADPLKGQYGAFSSCNTTTRYSWAANQYYQRHGNSSCNLNSTLELLDPRPQPAATCIPLLQQAGPNGESTVTQTSFPTLTATPNAPSNSRPRLSPGRKAGIGVGVTIFVISVLVLGAVFLLRWRKARRGRSAAPSEPFQKPELDDTEKKLEMMYEVQDAREVTELPAEERAVEVCESNVVFEIETKERPVEIGDGTVAGK
ncbi:Glucanosyltransferase-domain-containing protein [Clohesyomyces aquaticus]|uniref:1,3-beta-glucanosyltransferase n=1 Tax=Clohesyomyces aquaticus TaxID=1231657 RepID=A0A1Y1YHB5_9PLEO|nr:Glucanosyltransferase-domain-containing protein [Clohesyomyces aquaticus]